MQGGEGVRQAEAVHGGFRKPGAVHAGHDAVHDDGPRRRERLEQARAALRGHVGDPEQGQVAGVCMCRHVACLTLSMPQAHEAALSQRATCTLTMP